MDPFSGEGKIKVAAVTGHHAFDVPGFHALFRSFPDVDAYIQHMEDWGSDWGKVGDQYHVVVFYHMPKAAPTDDGHWTVRPFKSAMERLGQTEQGILVLHHAIVARQRHALHASGRPSHRPDVALKESNGQPVARTQQEETVAVGQLGPDELVVRV